MRAVFVKTSTGTADYVVFRDYYPFGMEIGGRNYTDAQGYRYGYQGKYAEKDPETGWNAFELRMYDSRVGRWLTVDPEGEFLSPYVGMGNDPVNKTDATGGKTDNEYDVYRHNGKVTQVVQTGTKGGDVTDYIHYIDSYSTNVPGRPLSFNTIESNATVNVQWAFQTYAPMAGKPFRVPGYKGTFGRFSSQAIEPSSFNVEDMVGIGLLAKEGVKAIGWGLAKSLSQNAAKEMLQVSLKSGTGVSIVEASFAKGVLQNFSKHAFAKGRHADLGLAIDEMASKGFNFIRDYRFLLKPGDNTLIGNINGIPKSFKAFVDDGVIKSINMYPGISNRITNGNIINFGSLKW